MQHSTPRILTHLAKLMGTKVKAGKLTIPKKYGQGYFSGFIFNPSIRMMLFNYELHKSITIENPEFEKDASRMILFKFQHVFPHTTATKHPFQRMPSVLIGTSRVKTDAVIPIGPSTTSINIEIDAGYLKGLLHPSGQSSVVQGLLENTQPLFFEQMIYPAMQQIVDEIINVPVEETFQLFFLRVKAEELVCRLLIELEKREEQQLYPVNMHDIQTIYHIKESILMQLDTPPVINDLAAAANMSPTKLKRLFKQVFGDSIFSYYQAFRMKEAARLLKEEKLTVSDVGFRLGFINLSHFSRVFMEHIGMKPKQYSKSGI